MKKIFFVLALLFFSATAQAQVYEITSHTIDIDVDESGFAQISEKFYLLFPNEFHLKEFRDKTVELGISLDAWKQYNEKFHTSIGRDTDIQRAEIGFVEDALQYLEIKYSLNTPLIEKKGETSRIIEFSLLNRFFDQFLQGSVIIIPENTTITVKLPSFAEIQTPVKPEGSVTQNTVVWTGYKSSNILSLNYRIVKQIASINLEGSINALMQSPLFLVFVVIALVILGILLVKRKAISARVENYLIAHSELGGKEDIIPEEEN